MLKTGLLGTGYGVDVFAPAFRTNHLFKLSSVYSRDTRRAKEVKKSLGFKRYYDDWAKLIEEGDLDLVCIATPVHTHYEIAKYAIENGLHVIIAAPFSLTTKEAEELAELANQKEVIGIVAHHFNFFPARKYVTRMIRDGKIGVPMHVHRLFRTSNKLIYEATQSWKFNKQFGGGTMNIIGSHDIDFLLRGIGGIHRVQAVKQRVYTERQNREGEVFPCTADDAYQVNLDFHNGAKAAVSGSSVYPGKEANEFLFYGTEGLLTLRDDNEILFYDRNGKKERVAIPPNYQITNLPGHKESSPFFMLIEAMASAIYNGTEVTPTFDEAVHVQRVINSAHRSADEHSWIEIGAEEVDQSTSADQKETTGRQQIDKIYK